MPCFRAIRRQTVANETRLQALELAGQETSELKPESLALMTTERHVLLLKATELGMTWETFLDAAWSSECTEYSALALIHSAQQFLADEHAAAKRKREAKRSGRRGR